VWRMKQILQWLWYDRPVRTQILVAIGAVSLVVTLAGATIAILNTRTATRVEIEASLEVAQRFVAATLQDLAAQNKLGEMREALPLQLKQLRHVRILLMDSYGNLTVVAPEASGERALPQAPSWFSALVRPKLVGRAVRVVSIDHSDPVVIVGEPADEIAEAWKDFYSLALLWLLLDAVVLVILYIVLGRVLGPLAFLSRGIQSLKDGHYGTRLAEPKVKELALITNRFNTLSGALDIARAENSRLYQQLISVQEQERREIASELHDEAGPCLFGITANASSIRNIASQFPNKPTSEISRRVGEILAITERLKLMNRALLKKLRPGSLGRVGLGELLAELVGGFRRAHPDTEIRLSLGRLAQSYGENVDLTLYRSVQEGITNAIRHGGARHLHVDVEERTRGTPKQLPSLRLTLRDDGRGFEPATPRGFGLTAMTERVRTLGGTCLIEGEIGKGTTIHVEIPLQRAQERSASLELVGGMK
jgi:two-component system, NarL family, sensor histidine kinase UhpB